MTFEQHDLPNGESIFYRDSDHSYWKEVNGEKGKGRLTGVSTVTKPCDWRPDGLMGWVEKLTCAGVAELASEGPLPTDGKGVRNELWKAGLTWRQVRDAAAERGTAAHVDYLAALAAGDKVPSLADASEEARAYCQAVLAFWRDHDPVPLASEQVVGSHELGVAGRFDLLYQAWGKAIRLDAKTGTYLGASDHAQLAGYEHLADLCAAPLSDEQMILQLRDDGSYALIPCQASTEDFLAALAVYRAASRIVKAHKKAAA